MILLLISTLNRRMHVIVVSTKCFAKKRFVDMNKIICISGEMDFIFQKHQLSAVSKICVSRVKDFIQFFSAICLRKLHN